jgi:nicotinate-nucleotide adenylyltransferase
VIPSGNPYLKSQSPTATAAQRFQMTDLAVTSMGLAGKVEVLPIEVNKTGHSYTFDTVVELEQKFSNANFTLILGSDAARNLDSWYRSEDLLKKVKILVISRPSEVASDFDEINIKALDISSTKVRQSITKRENVSELLPAKVVTFIREFGLYGSR